MASWEGVTEQNRAKKYSSIKYTLAILETTYLICVLLIFLSQGFAKDLAGRIYGLTTNIYLAAALYLLVASVAYYLLSFPFSAYNSYILEHKFSLSNQNMHSWFIDQIKSWLILYVIGIILISAFYFILRHYPYTWWLIISAFWIFFSLILAKLTPTIIIPLFFKYKKLSDENLRERILKLADKMKVKILDCFEIDFSKKTLKANAAFVGWGSGKRVILADTLKDKYSYEEIEVILAHEFAHYKLRHLLKLIIVNSFLTVVCFYLISKTSSFTLRIFDLTSLSDIAALPVIIIYFVFLGIIMQPFSNFISRIMEKNADIAALRVTGLKDAFVSVMGKLAAQNLADRSPSPLIKFFFFDHPPVDERIAIAKALQ